MSTYADLLASPVMAPLQGREAEMKENSAGGFVFGLSSRDRLLRFLILGADGATYYASRPEHFKQAHEGALLAIRELGEEAVDLIVEVSQEGRAPKVDPAIFALALCVTHGSPEVRKRAVEALPLVCRIPTHLFSFLTDVKALGGKLGGRQMKRALQSWYLDKDPQELAYALVKYRQRGGWTHGDVLRLCKPVGGNSPSHGDLFAWAVGKPVILDNREHMRIIEAYEAAKDENLSAQGLAALVLEGGLPREALPDVRLASGKEGADEIWKALLMAGGGMPLTALIRNLNRMTGAGVFKDPASLQKVQELLGDEDRIARARVHPLLLLSALRTYSKGQGERGSLAWTPVPQIQEALEKAYHLSFRSFPATGKRLYVGLDVSGSMAYEEIAGVPGLTPREASAALGLLWAAKEPSCIVKGFTASGWGSRHQTGLTDLTDDFKTGTLTSVQGRVRGLDFGATQPALIIEDALTHRIPVDAFFVLTDNEVNSGDHPSESLKRYRREMGLPHTKLIVIGMTATEFTLADPADPDMYDFVGFDSGAPAAIAEILK